MRVDDLVPAFSDDNLSQISVLVSLFLGDVEYSFSLVSNVDWLQVVFLKQKSCFVILVNI